MDSQDASEQGARDTATILPFILAILLAPPIITIFAVPVTIGRWPLILVYLFGVWAAAILINFLLARRLGRLERANSDQSTRSSPSGADADR